MLHCQISKTQIDDTYEKETTQKHQYLYPDSYCQLKANIVKFCFILFQLVLLPYGQYWMVNDYNHILIHKQNIFYIKAILQLLGKCAEPKL